MAQCRLTVGRQSPRTCASERKHDGGSEGRTPCHGGEGKQPRLRRSRAAWSASDRRLILSRRVNPQPPTLAAFSFYDGRHVENFFCGRKVHHEGHPNCGQRQLMKLLTWHNALSSQIIFGAGERNRTAVLSLEGCCSTIELHPRAADQLSRPARRLNLRPP